MFPPAADTDREDPGQSTALKEDLIQTLRDTGVYGYAHDADLLQEGDLPFQARANEDPRLWTRAGDTYGATGDCSFSEEEIKEGELRVAAANAAVEAAVSIAEQIKLRQKAAHDLDYPEDGMQYTPSKPRKVRRGTGKLSGDIGGRNSNKGLRHFSMKVCEKVEGKGRTTYNEVADELVKELPGANESGSPIGPNTQFDEKNIRRRVYDALNVLMAMDIITREKKEIHWKGLPQGPQLSLDRLRNEKQRLCLKLDQQRRYVAELAQQQNTYRSLIARNRHRSIDSLAQNGGGQLSALPLPFVLIQVDKNATVEIKISEDNRMAHFDFEGMPFKFTGDEQVLQEMGLADTDESLTARAVAAAAELTAHRSLGGLQAHFRHGTHPSIGVGPPSRAHPVKIPGQLLQPTASAGLHTGESGLNLLGNAAAVAMQRPVADWQRNGTHPFEGQQLFAGNQSPGLVQAGTNHLQHGARPLHSPESSHFLHMDMNPAASLGIAAMESSPQMMNLVSMNQGVSRMPGMSAPVQGWSSYESGSAAHPAPNESLTNSNGQGQAFQGQQWGGG